MSQVSNDKAVSEIALLLRRLNDCNPDVGMGPSWSAFVYEALAILELNEEDIDPSVFEVIPKRK